MTLFIKTTGLFLVFTLLFACTSKNDNAGNNAISAVSNSESSETKALDTKYQSIKFNEKCWQANKEITLYAQPNSKSKVEGPHFQGELLKVLGTHVIDNHLWVNVTYLLKVADGYEGQFADGQVMSSGSPTGWIGGEIVPQINCK